MGEKFYSREPLKDAEVLKSAKLIAEMAKNVHKDWATLDRHVAILISILAYASDEKETSASKIAPKSRAIRYGEKVAFENYLERQFSIPEKAVKTVRLILADEEFAVDVMKGFIDFRVKDKRSDPNKDYAKEYGEAMEKILKAVHEPMLTSVAR